MEGSIEAAGALATAAGVAAVIDGNGGPHGAGSGHACLNCGAPVAGKYCGQCGQSAHVHRSIGHAVEELLHGVWHFDSKLWRTLPMLFVRPGTLTRDYVMGRRARYISPFALFLLTIFLMFFVFGLTGGINFNGTDKNINLSGTTLPSTPKSEAQIEARVAELDRAIAGIEADMAGIEEGPGKAGEMAGLRAARSAMVRSREQARDPALQSARVDEDQPWVSAVKAAAESENLLINTGNESLNKKARHALNNPELALYKVQQKGYKLSFLLLPLSLPWMMLLFAWKRDVRTYDHVVFLLYSISFMSMVVLLAVLLTMAGLGETAILGFLLLGAPPLHMFLQLKGAYQLSTVSALWRTVALILMSLVTLALYFTLIVALGLVD